MQRIGGWALAVVIGVLLDTAALAAQATYSSPPDQTEGESWGVGFGLGGGVAIPLGSLKDRDKVGWEATGLVRFRPPGSPVGFQIDGAYYQMRLKSGVSGSPGKTQIIDATGDLVFTIPMSTEVRVRPYILGGAGVYGVKTNPDAAGLATTSVTKFGLNGGLGLDFGAGPANIFIAVRYHNIFSGTINNIGGTSSASLIPITAGIRIGA